MLGGQGIPSYMEDALTRYIDYGIPPGGFLMAVLENDLVEAALRADSMNIHLLPNYARLLAEEFPANAWGSPEIVYRWMKSRERYWHNLTEAHTQGGTHE